MKIPTEVIELVKHFQSNAPAFRSGTYNETQVRREFIDPFFEALGWDVCNQQKISEIYKEVIHEDAIKVGGSTKAPDYCFRLGGTRKFFVEAKKPLINLDSSINSAFQIRRYGWSAKLPISILTDFEELALYDCRVMPVKTDKPTTARMLYIKYSEYADRWEEIHTLFSKEAVQNGSLDQFAGSKPQRGTATVDAAFLKEIESWREQLAVNLSLRNSELNQRELNFAVQMTVNRLIFLRICEDRSIEPYGQLLELQKGKDVYEQLRQLFHRADDRYNSGLFHFKKESGRLDVDEFTINLKIDDKPLQGIIQKLYYPDSPYEFSVIPIEILGQVYEQFLGKVISLNSDHKVVIEDKPEVRKAGGVYYTPAYIVDYIVKNTVGKLLEGKTPKQAKHIKCCDIACGSGSFLIGAYQFLLDWYLEQYMTNTQKYKKQLYQNIGGSWLLTSAEKKEILLNNIYGVDIDTQAVETTKLSLLLKVLEGESQETVSRQMKLFQDRALPDLDNNIKCGNSLISSDFYKNIQLGLLDEDEKYRINVFDWEREFKSIIKTGGFDVIIGNPPYVDIKALPKQDVKYIFSNYQSSNNRINLFAAFVEKAINICKSSDFRFSMIVPTALLTQDSYRDLRRNIVGKYQVTNLVRLPNELFGAAAGDVKVDTVIIGIKEREHTVNSVNVICYAGYERISNINPTTAQVYAHVQQSIWAKSDDCIWSINTTQTDGSILQKCQHNSLPLDECANFCLGLTPYDKYKGHTQEQIKNKVFHANFKKDESFKKLLAGNDLLRYRVSWNGQQWISYGSWLGAPREQKFFTEKRILVKQIIDWTTKRIWATITDEELYNTQNAFNLISKTDYKLEYLLGILNSRLITFYHRKKFLDEFKMRFQKLLIKDCRRFPIRIINFSNSTETEQHDCIVSLVEYMLSLHKQVAVARTNKDKTLIQRQIDEIDRQIDKLVYELYGLTEEEIAIVESAV